MKRRALAFTCGAEGYGIANQLLDGLSPDDKREFKIDGENLVLRACTYRAERPLQALKDKLESATEAMCG